MVIPIRQSRNEADVKNYILTLYSFFMFFSHCVKWGESINITLLLELYFSSICFVGYEVVSTDEKTQKQNKLLLAKPSRHECYK